MKKKTLFVREALQNAGIKCQADFSLEYISRKGKSKQIEQNANDCDNLDMMNTGILILSTLWQLMCVWRGMYVCLCVWRYVYVPVCACMSVGW